MNNNGHTITALDAETVRQIAAGEVVERPASVVKELVENSLDADATRISVAVEAGGTAGIRVRDDGIGMDREAVQRAVKEHTTSKITDIDDLASGVGTLGFRGEALYTISAVSKMTVRTKPRNGDRGTELRVEGGTVVDVESAGCPEGTAIEISDLFFNTPARRKFLKTTATEFDRINTVVTHYALANPDIAITLEHSDREVFSTTGRGSLESAIMSVYGREVAESMVSIDTEEIKTEIETKAESITAVEGLVSHPETTRSTRQYLSTFINGRYVEARALREAIINAYGDQLAADRYPFAVLFLDIDPGSIDVNVHPRKMEVRFGDETGVRNAVTSSVRETLLSAGLIRSRAPRGRSAPSETEITQSSPDVTTETTESGTDAANLEKAEKSIQENAESPDPTDSIETENQPQSDRIDNNTVTAESDTDAENQQDGTSGDSVADTTVDSMDTETADHVDPTSDAAWTVDTNHRDDDTDSNSSTTQSSGNIKTSNADTNPTIQSQSTSNKDDDTTRVDAEEANNSAVPNEDDVERQTQIDTSSANINEQSIQHDLTGDVAALEPTVESLPSLRILGQIDETYIIAESDDGLILIDQHAADERINYERLQTALTNIVTTQALAEPVEVELTAGESAQFKSYADALETLGFGVTDADDNSNAIMVTAVPTAFASTLDPTVVRDVLSETADSINDHDGSGIINTLTDNILADLACYPSLTGNTALTEGSTVELLEKLDVCENPYACPHGRPVLIEIDRDELDVRFERDYPGHDGHRLE
jgi:DNA mismatch repair protein MutL